MHFIDLVFMFCWEKVVRSAMRLRTYKSLQHFEFKKTEHTLCTLMQRRAKDERVLQSSGYLTNREVKKRVSE